MGARWIQVDGLSAHTFLSFHSKNEAIRNEKCGGACRKILWRNRQRASRSGNRSRGGGVRNGDDRGEGEKVTIGCRPGDNEPVHPGDDGTEVGRAI